MTAHAARDERVAWLRQLLAWRDEVEPPPQATDRQRDDRIYVLTPAGHVLDMPEGSTPVDVAYRVHTQIGQRCVGARVDGEEVALNVPLSTGQRVEIITDERAQPSRDWLDQNLGYVRTARALAKIQSWFRSLERAQNVTAGRTMLLEEFDRLAIPVDLPSVAAQVGYADVDALCFAVAVGERQLLDVIAALARVIEPEAIGPVVHIDVASIDRAGILHDITGVLGQQDISMVSIQATSDEKGNTATIRLGVEIRDLLELATLLDRIRRVTGVTQVKRHIEAD